MQKEKVMTIKRRLFISNIRMVLIAFAAIGLTGRMVAFLLFGTGRPGSEVMAQLRDSHSHDLRMAVFILFFALFVILISVINNFLTQRMTRRIVKPLEPLTEGVRQIHDNNFSYRIDYQGDDEFTPVCDAFNEMAVKLEESTIQQKKNEANRRELIAGISHDLRTPLTSIKGCIEGIETGVASTPDMQKKYFSVIKNKTAALEHIIEQLFLFSKLDMDEFPLTMRHTDIASAIYDIIEDCRSEYEARGLGIIFASFPENCYVAADVLLLRNVIINILENSVKYKNRDYGQLVISAAEEDHSFVMRFTDDGPGVEAGMLPKLFDAFYRSDPSRSKLGSGLGLAISAKIIQRMGGSINAESPDDCGLGIVIRLPLTESRRSEGDENNGK